MDRVSIISAAEAKNLSDLYQRVTELLDDHVSMSIEDDKFFTLMLEVRDVIQAYAKLRGFPVGTPELY